MVRKPIKTRNYAAAAVMLIVLSLLLLSCGKTSHVTIGFLGCLSGKSSDLGINGRNGLMIAVHEINSSGGIKGRKVIVSVKDDRFAPRVALEKMREFRDEDVKIVVGPMTSAIAERILGFANNEEILLISPSATTDSLTGKDDFFFRVQPPNETESLIVAGYLNSLNDIETAALVMDISNDLYVEDWADALKKNMEGSSVTLSEFRYDSRKRPSYYSIAEKLLSNKPQYIIMVTDAVDAALICQQLRKMEYKGGILSSIWAKTYEFLQNAGSSGDGVMFFQHYDEEFLGRKFQQFKVDYMKRYGYAPDYSSISTYEAAMVIFRVMEQYSTIDSSEIKEHISDYGFFNLLHGRMHYDEFGDPQFGSDYRRTLVTVKEGYYVKVDE